METWQIYFICVIALLGFLCFCCVMILTCYGIRSLVYILLWCFPLICPPNSDKTKDDPGDDIKDVNIAEKSEGRAIESKPFYTPSQTPDITVPISPMNEDPKSVA